MIDQKIEEFQGYDCLRIGNGRLTIWATRSLGPRVIGLALDEGQNLLAVLPDASLTVEGREPYRLRGGHRLWYGPEDPLTTYLPDDQPLEIESLPDGALLIQPPEPQTGIQKSIRIDLDDEQPRLKIDHRLTNLGERPFRLAPWAVTMLAPGGLACLPLATEADDPLGLWPNRQIVLWPYTSLDSPWLELTDQALYVRAGLSAGALKIGAPNPLGWIAYSNKNCLFVKKARYVQGLDYADRGASSQIYCSPDVIELETLGPLTDLPPGKAIEHQETWELYPAAAVPERYRRYLTRI